jgi:FKBP-type peptidyl-prolyl cis-trans isomerase SlpA
MSTVETTAQPLVQQGSFLTLHYRMAGAALDGQPGADIINTFGGKPATLSLGTGELSPAIEQQLIGLAEGTRTTFELAAGAAFGERNPDLLYKVGDVVQVPTPDGLGQYAGSVQQVKGPGDAVQFDFNHPLAGQPVVFEVQVIGIL